MNRDSARHHRRSLRLKGYDYTQAGAYFVTICAQDRTCLFGEVVDGVMCPNDAGRMVETIWDELPIFYPGVDIDGFVVMPNHIHGIIALVGAAPCGRPRAPCGRQDMGHDDQPDSGQAQGPAPTAGLSLADVVHRFKTLTTRRYADGVKQSGWPVFRGRLWQRNYYEHVIRNDSALNRIRRYIDANPLQWAWDDDNPQKATS